MPYQAFIVERDTFKNRVHHFFLYTGKEIIYDYIKLQQTCDMLLFIAEKYIYTPILSKLMKLGNLYYTTL